MSVRNNLTRAPTRLSYPLALVCDAAARRKVRSPRSSLLTQLSLSSLLVRPLTRVRVKRLVVSVRNNLARAPTRLSDPLALLATLLADALPDFLPPASLLFLLLNGSAGRDAEQVSDG